MGFFGYFIISFIFTFISVKFFKLIYNDIYIKNEFISNIATSIISLFFIFIYIWTIKTNDFSFYKTGFLDFYFSYDTFLSASKILVFTGLIIIIVNSITSLVFNIFCKNKKIYYLITLLLYLALFFMIIKKGIISFDIPEPQYLFNLLPPIGSRIKYGIIFGILLSYIIDYNNEKNKNNISSVKKHIKNIIVLVLFLAIIYFQYYNTITVYPNYLYEKALDAQLKKYFLLISDDLANSSNNLKKLELRKTKFDDIKVGNTVSFGRREADSGLSGKIFEDIDWIVLDKNDDEKQVLLLSKNGLDVVRNKAIEQRLMDYEYYSSYYDDDYEYDNSSKEEYNYNNSALRFEMYNCYKDFVAFNLSKDENKEYNEYNLKDNIVDTYLTDTKTYEKFFPLSKDEYDKYKKIDGVGNFIFINNSQYIIFNRQFRNIFYVLRTFNHRNFGYNFLCVDTPYDVLTYEMNEKLLKNNNYIIGNTFWFDDNFIYDYKDPNYNEHLANDLDHGHIDVVLRPAMWYKLSE